MKPMDHRRRSVGVPRGDTDNDGATPAQRGVSEYMKFPTPPSSFEENRLRETTLFETLPSCDSPLTRYESDGEGANEVVTATQSVVGKADLIVKEDVPEVRLTASQPGQDRSHVRRPCFPS